MIMSVCAVMHFLVVAVRMPLIPVFYDPVKMELNVVQSWIMTVVVLTTSLSIDSLLLLTALQLHVCRMTFTPSFRLTDRLTKRKR